MFTALGLQALIRKLANSLHKILQLLTFPVPLDFSRKETLIAHCYLKKISNNNHGHYYKHIYQNMGTIKYYAIILATKSSHPQFFLSCNSLVVITITSLKNGRVETP